MFKNMNIHVSKIIFDKSFNFCFDSLNILVYFVSILYIPSTQNTFLKNLVEVL